MQTKRVAILVETSLASGREIVSGISRFAHEGSAWSISFHTGPLGAMAPSFLRNWSGDGIIARIADREIHELAASAGAPVVDVLGNVTDSPFPLVKCDDAAISRLVAEHLHARGHRNLAFFGLRGEFWSGRRLAALRAFCQENRGLGFHSHEIIHADRVASSWPGYMEQLCLWIAQLPKPVGIMAASDQFAPDLIEACRRLGLAVPDQVSIVGVDNDKPFVEICQPRLSSVEPNHERLGYVAARLLDSIMREPHFQPPAFTAIEPRILHVRQSSDATALEDPALVKALRYIRANACSSIGVEDIAAAAGVSRSVLQRRFRAVLKKSVLDAILAVRLSRAKEMLAKTDLPLPDVAERAGFKHQEYLGYVFKKHTATTPGQYRATTRISP